MLKPSFDPLASSFRDPAGYIYRGSNNILYRRVHNGYREDYEHLMRSGLYEALTEQKLLVQHQERKEDEGAAYCYTLQPVEVPFVSYPYEWSFSQFKDAALLTLEVQAEAFSRGMELKDASVFNILFGEGKPVFIDTLSFKRHQNGTPWVAYRQFCQHFLAPLALSSYHSPDVLHLLLSHIDGIPLDLASKLLPAKSYLSFGLMLHIHLHARAQAKPRKHNTTTRTRGRDAIVHLVSSLRDTIRNLTWKPTNSLWSSYYADNNNYSGQSMAQKEQVVEQLLTDVAPTTVWDVGANTGRFSKIAARLARQVIATDIDPAAADLLYQEIRQQNIPNIYPLVADVTNPSPGIGWLNQERAPLLERMAPDTILALAIVHHLLFSYNIPLLRLVHFFQIYCNHLIIEFVPREDSQVQLLLTNKEDTLPEYSQTIFEDAFSQCFIFERIVPLVNSSRVIYLMKRKQEPNTYSA